MRTLLLASALSLSLALPAPAFSQDAQQAQPTAPASAVTLTDIQPAPVSELVSRVDIPYDRFTLDNGLTVLVHEDRKAPVVAVSVWYEVGSKNEPQGKTGFAHLFEHLMFNGSENAPGDFFEPLQQVGATDFNGTTWFDRTNYFETVPTGALDLALFLESDRMGHLLGAVTQEKLDNQIGVVQNEKRQGDNQPYGLVEYEQLENLYPSGHPYHHSTIGSMEDLSGATLEDVRQWFRDHYGPNNAVLVLAGDIDTATAREKVTKWFGEIPAGPEVKPVSAPVPTLDAPKSKTIKDQVATTRLYRMWAIPGLDNPDHLPLQMASAVLGGLASSRLDNTLVRGDEVAVSVSSSADTFAQAGQFVIYADVKPGVDPATVSAALDRQIADFIANGPTADELQRASTVYASGQIRGLDGLGGFNGKAPTLAEGLLYHGDPEAYKTTLRRAASLTPQEVQSVTARWLSRPPFSLTVEPGTRTEGGENRGGFRTAPERHPAYYADPALGIAPSLNGPTAAVDRSQMPQVGDLKALDFPDIQRATLSNGMEVYFARRPEIPTVNVRVAFDAGYAADPKNALGTQSLMLELMDEGTVALDATELAIAKERLGASIGGMANSDTTSFQLSAVTPNLSPSLELLADYIRRPAFDAEALERVRAQQVTRIQAEMKEPSAIAQRALFPILYGQQHPYGIPPSGTGDLSVVQNLSAADLARFHDTWLRPDTARVFVVGDTTLPEITRQLEQAFGDWQAPATPAPEKNFDVAIPAPQQRIILIDRPASPQSVIMAGRVLEAKGTDDLVVLEAANDVLGGNFLSRLNMDLRETKGWSYGVRSLIRAPLDRSSLLVYAPVQADRTGDSIVALREQLGAYVGDRGTTPQELQRLINGNVRELPGRFETSGGVLEGVSNIVTYGRPDDYYETLADKYQSLTADQLDAVARRDFLDRELVFVVVGDASVVRPQLEALGLPVEVRSAGGE